MRIFVITNVKTLEQAILNAHDEQSALLSARMFRPHWDEKDLTVVEHQPGTVIFRKI